MGRAVLGGWMAWLALPAAAAAQAPTPEQAGAALEAGLLPTFVVEGRDTTRIPLIERMAQFRVPGVSVAVMLGGEVAWRAVGA